MAKRGSKTGNDLRLNTQRLELIAGTADLVRAHLGNPEGFALQLDARAPRISPPSPAFWTRLASSSEERVQRKV